MSEAGLGSQGQNRLHENAPASVLYCVILTGDGRVAVLIFLRASLAQGQSTSPKQFDVSSVKAYSIQDGNFMIRPQPDGTFRAVGVTLKMLIMFAYNVKAFQVSGAPGWVGTDLWEITAKADDLGGADGRTGARARVQALLEERFLLKAHLERHTMPVYALFLANGSRAKLTAASGGDQPGILPQRSSVAATRASMAMLADQLSTRLWRTVIDKTGMKGYYAFKLEWTPEPNEYGPEALGLPPSVGSNPVPEGANLGPTIFTALREQLGLRLKSEKGLVEVVVIDRVAKPTGN